MALPPLVSVLTADISGFSSRMSAARADMSLTEAEANTRAGGITKAFAGTAALALGAGLAAVGVESVKLAANFQKLTTNLVTDAGESVKNIDMIRAGVLKLSTDVGAAPAELAKGLFQIESAGYHGADALKVLRASAIAGKVGLADMEVVANATTTAMRDYNIPASQAAHATDVLLQIVAQGKTHFQDLAGSISTVLPAAAAAGVSFEQVGGALAAMTAKGVSADQASTFLRQAILKLSNPTGAMAKEWQSLGIDAFDLSNNLGKRGLTGTFEVLTDAIKSHVGPTGAVLIEHLQKAAKNTTAYQQVLAQLPPSLQTYVGALATAVGGTKVMQAALMLSGPGMDDFKAKVDLMAHASDGAGKTMDGWKLVQQNFSTQMDRARASVDVLLIGIGTALLPVLAAGAQAVADLASAFERGQTPINAVGNFIGQHTTTFKVLGVIIATLLVPTFVGWTVAIIANTGALIAHAASAVFNLAVGNAFLVYMNAVKIATFAWTAAQWLLNVALDANPIGLAAIAIAALVGAIIFAYSHSETFRKIVAGLMVGLGGLWGQVVKVGQAVWGFGAQVVDAATHLNKFYDIVVQAIGRAVAWVGREIPKIPAQIGFALAFAVTKVAQFQADVGNWFLRLGAGLISWAATVIPQVVTTIITFLNALPGRILTWGVSVMLAMYKLELAMIGWAIRAIPQFVGTVMAFLGQLPGQIVGWVGSVVGEIGKLGGQLTTWAANNIPSFVSSVMAELGKLPGKAWQIGMDMVSGVANGIRDNIGIAIGAIGSFVGGIISGAHAAGKGGSPYQRFADEVGAQMIAGVAVGINSSRVALNAMRAHIAALAGAASVQLPAPRIPAVDTGSLQGLRLATAATADNVIATYARMARGMILQPSLAAVTSQNFAASPMVTGVRDMVNTVLGHYDRLKAGALVRVEAMVNAVKPQFAAMAATSLTLQAAVLARPVAAGVAPVLGPIGGTLQPAGQRGGATVINWSGDIKVTGERKDARQVAIEVRNELLRMKKSIGTLGLT